MRDELFELACVFVILFLLIVAFLYWFRPTWLIKCDDSNNPDIDMWKSFLIALLGALLGVMLYTLIPYPFC